MESFVTVETLKYAADLTDKSCRFLSVENINFFLIWFRLNAGNNKVEQVWPTFPLPSLFFFFLSARERVAGIVLLRGIGQNEFAINFSREERRWFAKS